jgi:DNA-binding MarR family transcriptional regulator
VTLAALEGRGLVERRPGLADGRRVTMSVTAAGQQVLRNKRSAQTEQLAASSRPPAMSEPVRSPDRAR